MNRPELFTGPNALSQVGGIRRASREHHVKVMAKTRRDSLHLPEMSRSLEIGSHRLQAAASRE